MHHKSSVMIIARTERYYETDHVIATIAVIAVSQINDFRRDPSQQHLEDDAMIRRDD